MIVVDASVVVASLLGNGPEARACRRALDTEGSLHAPELLDVEVLSALRRMVSLGLTGAKEGGDLVTRLAQMPISRHAHGPLITRIYELRGAVSAYDAAYLALGEVLNAEVLTLDGRLSRSNGHYAAVRRPGSS